MDVAGRGPAGLQAESAGEPGADGRPPPRLVFQSSRSVMARNLVQEADGGFLWKLTNGSRPIAAQGTVLALMVTFLTLKRVNDLNDS